FGQLQERYGSNSEHKPPWSIPDTGEPIPLSRARQPDGQPDVSEVVKKALCGLAGGRASGRPVKQMYEEYVDLANEMIRKAGYMNFAKLVRSPREGQDFEQVMVELFNGLLPLYKELHGYMFEASQDFFASLGLGNMTDTFWAKSVLEKLPELTWSATLREAAGGVRGGANPGFHEAIGDTIELYKLLQRRVPKNLWNSEWGEPALQLMGVSSPVLRSEEGLRCRRYLSPLLLQFQFHQSLCQAAVSTATLPPAQSSKPCWRGGTSLHWEEALFKISGTRQISAKPLLDYFATAPGLHLLPKNKENGVSVGWGNNCPPDDCTQSASQLGSLSACQVFALAAIACFTVPRPQLLPLRRCQQQLTPKRCRRHSRWTPLTARSAGADLGSRRSWRRSCAALRLRKSMKLN
uniref:Peptidase_M3 domain-containing protein n=1 Tax=Macrostomum lignano TaxID=282301 RepID=A0A1I8FM15_9PLAT